VLNKLILFEVELAVLSCEPCSSLFVTLAVNEMFMILCGLSDRTTSP
jgi:hypothetical protein